MFTVGSRQALEIRYQEADHVAVPFSQHVLNLRRLLLHYETTEESAWVAVEGKVYDVTEFLEDVSFQPFATTSLSTNDADCFLLNVLHFLICSSELIFHRRHNSTLEERRSCSRTAARTLPRLSGPTTARRSSKRWLPSTTLASLSTLLSSKRTDGVAGTTLCSAIQNIRLISLQNCFWSVIGELFGSQRYRQLVEYDA